MFFLLRMAFWLCIVLMLLPTGGSAPDAGPRVSALDAVSAASATVSDLRRFCDRQPDACQVGTQTAVALGQRAEAGAKLLYQIITEQMAQNAASPVGPETTSTITTNVVPLPLARPMLSVAARPAMEPAGRLQNTLTADDLAPAWRGPGRHANLDNGA